jgi:hypothetical protein
VADFFEILMHILNIVGDSDLPAQFSQQNTSHVHRIICGTDVNSTPHKVHDPLPQQNHIRTVEDRIPTRMSKTLHGECSRYVETLDVYLYDRTHG